MAQPGEGITDGSEHRRSAVAVLNVRAMDLPHSDACFLKAYPAEISEVSVANSYSRGDREFEKATAMLFPSEIAQRGRMRDHTAARFRRRVSV